MFGIFYIILIRFSDGLHSRRYWFEISQNSIEIHVRKTWFITNQIYNFIFLFLNLETTGKNKILHVNFNVIFIFNNQQHKYEHYH